MQDAHLQELYGRMRSVLAAEAPGGSACTLTADGQAWYDALGTEATPH